MRITPSILCFFLLFSAAPGADPVPSSPTDTYISARDQAAAKVCAIKETKAQDQALDHALPELGRLMAAAVPAWQGAHAKGTFTIAALCRGDIDVGRLDGWEYEAGDTTVNVTSVPLLKRWLIDHRNWWPGKKNVPTSMTAAFRSEAFYTQALSTDAAAYLHGLVLVKAPVGTEVAVAELAGFAQDYVMDAGPDRLLVVVVRGERVFIANQKLAVATTPVPYCQKAMQLALAHAKTEKDSKKSETLEDAADRDYRACFAQRLREQPNYAAIQKQAQALVDLLN